MREQDVVDLGWVVAALRRWWWLVVGCALLGIIVAYAFTAWMPPVYSASATLLVQPELGSGMSDYQSILTGQWMARTYALMLQEESVLEETADRLGLRDSPATLAQRVGAEPIPDTQLIRLSVQADSPTRASLLANTLAETFIQRVQALEAERNAASLTSLEIQMTDLSIQIEATQESIDSLGAPPTGVNQSELTLLEDTLAGYRSTYAILLRNHELLLLNAARSTQTVAIAEPARASKSPIQNRPLYVAVAGLVGILAGLGVALLLENMDYTIRTPHDLRKALGANTISTIPRLNGVERDLVMTAGPHSAHAEAFRVLSANVGLYDRDSLPKAILVTSPRGDEGKSLILANLAATLAQAGLSVVAVDADWRRPTLGGLFDLDPRSAGLSRALQNGSVDDLLQPTHLEQLAILTSGALPDHPTQLLTSPCLQEVLDELARLADVILVDGPPMLAVADTALIARSMDGVLLVVRAHRTRREAAQVAMENLRQAGTRVLGVVLNGVDYRTSIYDSTYLKYMGAASAEQQAQSEDDTDVANDGQAAARSA